MEKGHSKFAILCTACIPVSRNKHQSFPNFELVHKFVNSEREKENVETHFLYRPKEAEKKYIKKEFHFFPPRF